jgi:hypothetical protein
MDVVLRGFIDESIDGKEVIPRVFNVSCLVANNSAWPYIEWDWVEVLDEKNKELEKQGRKRITRFHASDFSNSLGEFKGWDDPDEKKEFVQQLVPIFGKHGIHTYGHDIPLQLLVSEIPETAVDPKGFAYAFLFELILRDICKNSLSVYPESIISLHHDHCDYDAHLQTVFGNLVDDKTFPCAHKFASLTPERWQHCIPLQPADFVAYENFKEGMRRVVGAPARRRKSLEMFLDLDSISGRSEGLTLQGIRKLKQILYGMDDKTRRLFMQQRLRIGRG